MIWFIGIALFAGGFVASIYLWPKLKEAVNGAETEIRAFEAKAKALRDKVNALRARL